MKLISNKTCKVIPFILVFGTVTIPYVGMANTQLQVEPEFKVEQQHLNQPNNCERQVVDVPSTPEFVSTAQEMALEIVELEKTQPQEYPAINPNVPIVSKQSSYLDTSMLSQCTYSAEELNKYLRFGLKGLGTTYKKVEQETGVNAMFLIAISALEGNHGRSPLAKDYNNIMGYGAFDGSVRDNALQFSSYEDCIRTVAKKLKEDYLTKGGRYYNGTDLESINILYSTDETWASQINQIIKDIDYFIQKGE